MSGGPLPRAAPPARLGSNRLTVRRRPRPAPAAAAAIVARVVALARRREQIVASAGAALVAGVLFGPHVRAGGRYLDDWWLGAYLRFPQQLGFPSASSYLDFYSGARPGAVAYWLATYKLFGYHDDWHRALGVVLAALLTAVFYLLLRELRLGRREAAAIALLSLALPVADSIHFWITPDVAQLGLSLCAGGLILGLRGLRAGGRRALALHAGALTAYAASMLIAETTVPAIGLSVLIYASAVDWRRALRWWAPEAALATAAAIHYALSAPGRRTAVGGDDSYLHHARVLTDQALTLVAGTLVPFIHTRLWVLVGLLALGILIARRIRTKILPETEAWLARAGLAAVFAAASYVIYIPSDPSYQPLIPGIGNRINIGALLPLSVLVFALARLIGGQIRHRWAASAVTWLICLLALAGGVARLHADRVLWDQAADQQRRVLSALHQALPDPPGGSALLVLNSPGVLTHFERVGVALANESVPVFSTWWELDAAVKLSYGRSDLDAYPIWSYQPAQVACGAHDIYQLGLDQVRHALRYGHVYAVDVNTPIAIRLDTPAACARVVTQATTVRYDLPV